MHLDMLVVVTLVVTPIFALVTMMYWLMSPLLSRYRLRVVGVDDNPPPLSVFPHLVPVLAPD